MTRWVSGEVNREMNTLMTERKFAAKPNPFWAEVPAHIHRSGDFWIPGERVEVNGKHFQRGPMYVAWESPEHVTHPYPIVLVTAALCKGPNGWTRLTDGRAGHGVWWRRGYAVLVVRPPGSRPLAV